MAFTLRTREDFEGHGLYEPVAPPGIRPRPLGQVPFFGAAPTQALASVLSTVVQTDATGLRVVRSDAKTNVVALLEQLKVEAESVQPGVIRGKAIPEKPQPWVREFVKGGFAVLVQLFGSTVLFIATTEPDVIAAERGSYVVVDAPAALLQAARALLTPSPSCPGGQALSPTLKRCVPIPGGVTTSSTSKLPSKAPQPGLLTSTGLPSWVLPVALIGGAGVAIVVATRALRKRSTASPARRVYAPNLSL